jgi:hypothetical protein
VRALYYNLLFTTKRALPFTVVDFKDPVRARLMLFNDTSHYADQPRHAEQTLSKWWDRP